MGSCVKSVSSYPAHIMAAHPLSSAVGGVRNDGPKLILTERRIAVILMLTLYLSLWFL